MLFLCRKSQGDRCFKLLSEEAGGNPADSAHRPGREPSKIQHIALNSFTSCSLSQLEIHLYNPQFKLMAYLKEKGIVPQAYSPLGSNDSPLLKDELVVKLAEKYNVQPANILLATLRKSASMPSMSTPRRLITLVQSPRISSFCRSP